MLGMKVGHSIFTSYILNVSNYDLTADMTVGASLEWVRFEWTAERSVKLKIRESTLTFST